MVPVRENAEAVHEAVERVAGALHLEVRGEDTGLADPGFPSMGSASFVGLEPTEIALVAEDPVRAYSFGWAWFTLERQHQVPVSVLRAGSLATTPLGRFDVLVLPDLAPEAFARLVGEEGLERIRRWVRDGGTLVTIGGATDLARGALRLIGLRSFYETPEGEGLAPIGISEVFVPVDLTEPAYDPTTLAQGDWVASGYDRLRLHAPVSSGRLLPALRLPPPRPEGWGWWKGFSMPLAQPVTPPSGSRRDGVSRLYLRAPAGGLEGLGPVHGQDQQGQGAQESGDNVDLAVAQPFPPVAEDRGTQPASDPRQYHLGQEGSDARGHVVLEPEMKEYRHDESDDEDDEKADEVHADHVSLPFLG